MTYDFCGNTTEPITRGVHRMDGEQSHQAPTLCQAGSGVPCMRFLTEAPNGAKRCKMSHKQSRLFYVSPRVFSTILLSPPPPEIPSSSHSHVWKPRPREAGGCARGHSALVPELGAGLSVCSHLRCSLCTSLHTAAQERPPVQDKTTVARTRKKRSASWWGVSEKGQHPSQALGLGRAQRGISRLFEVWVLGHSSLRMGRSVCCELAKWEVCVVGFHGMHWGRGALTVPSSVPECPRFFLPLCFTQQPSP